MIPQALYHWAPTSRRADVRAHGLRPFSSPTVCSGTEHAPYVCLSPTPRVAWLLSGDMAWVSDVEDWDLWEVTLGGQDEVHVRPFYGAHVEEVKVYTPIPADRLWLVGERIAQVFEEPA